MFFSEFFSLSKSEPIIAACELPRAGRNEHNGVEIKLARKTFFISLKFIFISFSLKISCSGIFCFFIMLVIKLDEPNKPESIGSNEF